MVPAIIGVLATRGASANRVYFTSVLYPYLATDTLNVGSVKPANGMIWQNILTDEMLVQPLGITSGEMDVVIAYPTYTAPSVDEFTIGALSVTGGEMDVVIAYPTYTAPSVDEFTIGALSVTGGEMDVVISYITYTSPAVDTFIINTLTLTSGTLV